MSDLNDKELFDSAINDAPLETETTQEAPVVETPAEQEARTRDDKGRFAPKEATQSQSATPEPAVTQQPNEAHVPSWRLREVNDAREAAERRANETSAQLQAMQREMAEFRRQNAPKPEPTDWFTDPDAALQQQLTPFEQRMQAMQTNFNLRASKAENTAIHGKETVAEVEKAIGEAMQTGHPDLPLLRQRMLNSDDPVGVALDWYQREKLVKETGGDLSSYKNKTLEDALNDPAFLAKALERARNQASGQAPNGRPNPTVQLPPSLNRAPSAASAHDDDNAADDRSLYQNAIR